MAGKSLNGVKLIYEHDITVPRQVFGQKQFRAAFSESGPLNLCAPAAALRRLSEYSRHLRLCDKQPEKRRGPPPTADHTIAAGANPFWAVRARNYGARLLPAAARCMWSDRSEYAAGAPINLTTI